MGGGFGGGAPPPKQGEGGRGGEGLNKIGIGRTAEVFRDDDGAAIKLFYDWMPETEAEREAEILQSVSQVCELAPKFYGLIRVEGRNGLRFELIEGKMAAEQMFAKPAQAFKIARAIGRLHRGIHALRPDSLWTAEDVFIPALQSSKRIREDTRVQLLDFLRESKGTALCHGDFHPENILIDKTGHMHVIDWVNAYVGDPLSDVARTYYLIRYGQSPNQRTPFEHLLESAGKRLIAGAYLRAYFAGCRIPQEDFQMWLLIVMINRITFERIAEEETALRKAIPRLAERLRL